MSAGARGRAVRGALFAAMTALAALVGACSRQPIGAVGTRPNVVLVTLDTVRADHCSVYGYSRPTTPGLQSLARAGTTFEAAYAPMATTSPSHATMLTGLHPRSHGVVKNGLVLGATIPTLAEVLRGAGYETAAFVSSYVLNARFGLARGFDRFDDDFTGANASFKSPEWEGMTVEGTFDRRADEVTSKVVAWLEARGTPAKGAASAPAAVQPLFLWVHYFDPHDPYEPPEPYRTRFAPSAPAADALARDVAAYDGEIAFTDAELARLVGALDRVLDPRNTLLVVVGDHGEGLMDHGHMHHGLMLFEEAVRVPWLVRWSGQVHAGARVAAPVGLVDLMPTVLALAGGTSAPRPLQGVSLAPVLTRGAPAPEHAVVMERRLYKTSPVDGFTVSGPKLAIRFGPWKYIEAPEEGSRQLFDVARDPAERTDLAQAEPARVQDLAERLARWRAATPVGEAMLPALPSEEEQRLRALGYTP